MARRKTPYKNLRKLARDIWLRVRGGDVTTTIEEMSILCEAYWSRLLPVDLDVNPYQFVEDRYKIRGH